MPSTNTVQVKALVPISGTAPHSTQIIQAGQTASIDEKVAVDLAAAGKVSITGTLSTRGQAYQTAVTAYIGNTTYPSY